MTDQQSHQQPYAGAPGAGYPQQDQIPQGQIPQQGSYGQAQQPYGGGQTPYGQPPPNPYAQAPQNPYGTPSAPNYGPAPKKARPRAGMIVRGVVGLAVLGVAVGGWIVKEHNKADRDSNGNISKQGNLSAFSVKAGDCFKKPTDAAGGFDSVKAIPCTQPHDAQAFYSFDYPNANSGTYPTDDQMDAAVKPQCTDAEKSKIDESKLPENAGMSYMLPDNQAWSKGHHDIMCVVENDTDFTGSVVKG